MKITYLDHSGFAAETEDAVCIFDYYKGEFPDIPANKKIYVFASHFHPDHFQKRIFSWVDRYSDVTYILSDDIRDQGPDGKTVRMKPNQEIQVDTIKIRTLRSTDEGVAFFVWVDGQTVYHAGDLNWWHWEEESDAYNVMMRRRYQREVDKLAGERIDIAFLPLDPRQGEQYHLGLDYFMRHTDTKQALPMHMWGEYGICERLLKDPCSEPYRDRIIKVTERGQVFLIGNTR